MLKIITLTLLALPCLAFAADQTPAPLQEQAQRQEQLQQQWTAYVSRSEQLRRADANFILKETKRRGLKEPLKPGYTKEFGFDTKQPNSWFATAEGSEVMEAILSLQTPSGGWSKRTDMTKKRRPGMAFGTEKNYIPTFDNDATTMQLTLLAKAYSATGKATYKEAFARGLELIFNAQYPNGGWPQNYPLVGGYHNLITYNDELMVNIMFLLRDVAQGKGDYAFITPEQRQRAQYSLDRAIECALNTQVMIGNQPTVWGAQHDPLTLMPAKARAYEMVSLTSTESVWMVDFFMTLDNPSRVIIESVHGAMAWYDATKIPGKIWVRGEAHLTEDASADGLWSRFYELGTNKPVFGDRDGSIHYDIGAISKERRAGYAWYTTGPKRLYKRYDKWAKQYPL